MSLKKAACMFLGCAIAVSAGACSVLPTDAVTSEAVASEAVADSLMAAAATGHFTDVASTHWAYQQIEAMAEGGLVSGYGDGVFGPDDSFSVAQMARIICNALGYVGGAKDGFWAYGCVDYCLNTLKCLPDLGEINTENYSIPITRELTIYMLVNGLGIQNASDVEETVTVADIPDSSSIDPQYVDAVLEAYRTGLTTGVDENKTFDPKGVLTRAEGAVMLVRAGYTQAAPISRVESSVAWENIKQLGAYEPCSDMMGWGGIRFTDPKYGGIKVIYNDTNGAFQIVMPERDDRLMYNKGHYIDVNGNVIDWPYNTDTYEYYASTAYCLEARQLCKKIAECIIGNKDIDEFYDSLKGVFLGTAYNGGGRPKSIKWLGDRSISILSCDDYSVSITFSSLDDQMSYKISLANPTAGSQWPPYYYLGLEASIIAFHLDQW